MTPMETIREIFLLVFFLFSAVGICALIIYGGYTIVKETLEVLYPRKGDKEKTKAGAGES